MAVEAVDLDRRLVEMAARLAVANRPIEVSLLTVEDRPIEVLLLVALDVSVASEREVGCRVKIL